MSKADYTRYTPLTITQSDIDRGVRKSSCACPIALAGFRTFNPLHLHVTKFNMMFSFTNPKIRDIILLIPNLAMRKFIAHFDEFGFEWPQTLLLEPCEELAGILQSR